MKPLFNAIFLRCNILDQLEFCLDFLYNLFKDYRRKAAKYMTGIDLSTLSPEVAAYIRTLEEKNQKLEDETCPEGCTCPVAIFE